MGMRKGTGTGTGMWGIYKVTGAYIGAAQNGHRIFNLQLNGEFLATKLFPSRKIDQKNDLLFNKYIENGRSLDFVVGKYISIFLEKNKYGINFSSVESLDALGDFKNLLDRSDGKAFATKLNMYKFLRERNYNVNDKGSIILKAPYDNFLLTENNVCYPDGLSDNCLTPHNIGLIFDKFYKGKIIDNGDLDKDERYDLTRTAIGIHVTVYHETKGGIRRSEFDEILRIGDPLTDEQYQYILNCQIEHCKT